MGFRAGALPLPALTGPCLAGGSWFCLPLAICNCSYGKITPVLQLNRENERNSDFTNFKPQCLLRNLETRAEESDNS